MGYGHVLKTDNVGAGWAGITLDMKQEFHFHLSRPDIDILDEKARRRIRLFSSNTFPRLPTPTGIIIPAVILLICLFFLVGCGADSLPELTADELLSKTAVSINSHQSANFAIERQGAPAYVDPDHTLAFRRAEGQYQAPDKAKAAVRIIAPGIVADVDVISIGSIQWQTNVLTGEWEELPPNWGFNPAVLFDPETGLQAILANDLQDVTVIGTEKLDGVDGDLYALTATASGEHLATMSGGMIEAETAVIQLWIAPETFDLRRVIVTEAMADGEEDRVWVVDFEYGAETAVIEPPE